MYLENLTWQPHIYRKSTSKRTPESAAGAKLHVSTIQSSKCKLKIMIRPKLGGINEWQGLLQIATSGITNCVSFGDYKLRQKVLQNATALLLQIATKSITNCVRYYKLRQIDYKLRQVLQIATLL